MKTRKGAAVFSLLFVLILLVSACSPRPESSKKLIVDTGNLAPTASPTPLPPIVDGGGDTGGGDATPTAEALSLENAVETALAQTAVAPTDTPTPTVTVTVTEVITTTAITFPDTPAARWDWLGAQQMLGINGCDPQTYLWWAPRGNDEGFKDTGGHTDAYDIVLHDGERLVAYGTDVKINGVDYGRAIVFADAPGRFAVVIDDGAYRIGVDDPRMGLFPEYYAKVVRCLYGGEFPVKQAPNAESSTPTPVPR